MKKVKKLPMMLVAVLMISTCSFTTFTSSYSKVDLSETDIILETSNLEIGLAFFIQDEIETQGYSTTSKTGSGYFYKTSNNEKIADFDCTGTFSL